MLANHIYYHIIKNPYLKQRGTWRLQGVGTILKTSCGFLIKGLLN